MRYTNYSTREKKKQYKLHAKPKKANKSAEDGVIMAIEANKGGRPTRKKNPFTDIFTKLVGDETQQEIADRIGVSRQNIGKWLSGNTTPDIETLCKIAAAYNVSTDYLLGLTDIPSSSTNVRTACEVTGLSQKSIDNLIFVKENGLKADMLLEDKNLLDILSHLDEIENCVVHKRYFDEVLLPIADKNDFYNSMFLNGQRLCTRESKNICFKGFDNPNLSFSDCNCQYAKSDKEYIFNLLIRSIESVILDEDSIGTLSENSPNAISNAYEDLICLEEFKVSKCFSNLIDNVKNNVNCSEPFTVNNHVLRDFIIAELNEEENNLNRFTKQDLPGEINITKSKIIAIQTYLDKYDENFKLKGQKGASDNGSNNPKKE